ncbi:hypothetical protein ACH0AH_03065 [Microbacterium paludicola]|uniref:hypothetical protein n=1 Tax=Microbacterium paludicola TaxID=300019 RepID=UPI00387A09DD
MSPGEAEEYNDRIRDLRWKARRARIMRRRETRRRMADFLLSIPAIALLRLGA